MVSRFFSTNTIRYLPIRKKLAILTIVPIAILCVAAFIYIPQTFEHQLFSALQSKTHSIAKIAAYSCRTGIMFHDKDAVEEVLRSLGQDTLLICAFVNDEHGDRVADFEKSNIKEEKNCNDSVFTGVSRDNQPINL